MYQFWTKFKNQQKYHPHLSCLIPFKSKYKTNIVIPIINFQGLKSNFSLHYQYTAKQTGEEKKENHQLGDTVLMNHQILTTDINRNEWMRQRRISQVITHLLVKFFICGRDAFAKVRPKPSCVRSFASSAKPAWLSWKKKKNQTKPYRCAPLKNCTVDVLISQSEDACERERGTDTQPRSHPMRNSGNEIEANEQKKRALMKTTSANYCLVLACYINADTWIFTT